jgi:hypothetical protein
MTNDHYNGARNVYLYAIHTFEPVSLKCLLDYYGGVANTLCLQTEKRMKNNWNRACVNDLTMKTQMAQFRFHKISIWLCIPTDELDYVRLTISNWMVTLFSKR